MKIPSDSIKSMKNLAISTIHRMFNHANHVLVNGSHLTSYCHHYCYKRYVRGTVMYIWLISHNSPLLFRRYRSIRAPAELRGSRDSPAFHNSAQRVSPPRYHTQVRWCSRKYLPGLCKIQLGWHGLRGHTAPREHAGPRLRGQARSCA